jgi:hypothetical protein
MSGKIKAVGFALKPTAFLSSGAAWKGGDRLSAHTHDNIVRFERVACGALQLGDSLVQIGLRA